MARVGLSKKQRFEVFKRDEFTCQYCGGKPPAVVLEVDHIVAVADGGGNDRENLTTACFECNRGKGAVALTALPQTVADRAELLEEREQQAKAFEALVRAKRRRESKVINEIEAILMDEGWGFSETFRTSVRKFLKELPYDEVLEAAELACVRIRDQGRRQKYFCGICWKKIKDSRL